MNAALNSENRTDRHDGSASAAAAGTGATGLRAPVRTVPASLIRMPGLASEPAYESMTGHRPQLPSTPRPVQLAVSRAADRRGQDCASLEWARVGDPSASMPFGGGPPAIPYSIASVDEPTEATGAAVLCNSGTVMAHSSRAIFARPGLTMEGPGRTARFRLDRPPHEQTTRILATSQRSPVNHCKGPRIESRRSEALHGREVR